MRHLRPLVVLFALLATIELQAQESPTASGGDATGSGGSSSYTVGQVVYITNTGSNGSVAQGVQQPYEISITTGVNQTTINLEIAIFPNPSTSYLQLNVENEALENLSFQLIDLQGKVIENKKVIEMQTIVNMEALPKAIYLLNITKNKQVIKTFKVIKQ